MFYRALDATEHVAPRGWWNPESEPMVPLGALQTEEQTIPGGPGGLQTNKDPPGEGLWRTSEGTWGVLKGSWEGPGASWLHLSGALGPQR